MKRFSTSCGLSLSTSAWDSTARASHCFSGTKCSCTEGTSTRSWAPSNNASSPSSQGLQCTATTQSAPTSSKGRPSASRWALDLNFEIVLAIIEMYSFFSFSFNQTFILACQLISMTFTVLSFKQLNLVFTRKESFILNTSVFCYTCIHVYLYKI